MRTRPLGASGISVSELALGTWGLSGDGYGPVEPAEQDRVIDRAVALGITCFESAASYGNGAMERRLGLRLAAVPGATIVTKLGTDRTGTPPRKRFERAFLLESFAQAVERLGRETIDVVLLHHPSLASVERGEATETLAELQRTGRTRAWGVSAGSSAVARAALKRGATVVSMAFNAFHSAPVREVSDDLATADIGLVAHSPLAYGLLAGLWTADRVFPGGDHRAERWSAEELRLRVRQLDALRPLVRGEVNTLRGAALRWVLSHAFVSTVALGPKSVLQLDQLVRESGRGPEYLSEAQLTAVTARLRDVGIDA